MHFWYSKHALKFFWYSNHVRLFEICLRFCDFKTLTQFEMHLGDIIYTCSRPNVQHIILFVYADLVSLKCIAVIYANSVFGRPQMQFS